MSNIAIYEEYTMTHVPHSTSAAQYMNELDRYPLLSDTEFDHLIERVQKGDQDPVNKIVEGNLRFVIQIASEYTYSDLPFADLIAEGNIGLIKAVEKFDPNLGYRFSTYAVWWIRNAIQKSLRHHRHPLRLPFNRYDDLDKIFKATEELSQTLGRQVSPNEAATHLTMTHRRATVALEAQAQSVSLDIAPSDDYQDGFLHEQISDASERPDETVERVEITNQLKQAMHLLNERDAYIIDLTFGFGNDPISLTEVGNRLGISKERVRQLRNRALTKLRSYFTDDTLATA
ncbi:MAG: RNA polymerase primary sigma factor [Candidatus Latescibacterota bacterium]|jgi:RNA polymerase primary sigma factor